MRRLGLIFYKNDECGMASVTVTDTVTAVNLVSEQIVDLYQSDKDQTLDEYEEFIFWVDLPYDTVGRYEWRVLHSGLHNPSAIGPNYNILFNGFVITEPNIEDAKIDKILIARDVDYPGIIYNYPITEQDKVLSLAQIVKYNGDGVTDTFEGAPGIIGQRFVEYSIDGGLNWKPVYAGDYMLTWGSNILNNDNTMSAGKFNVVFTTPPAVGIENVQFKVIPSIDRIKCTHTFKNGIDKENFTILTEENKLLHYNLELIK